MSEVISQNDVYVEQKALDVQNNNHLSSLESQTKYLSLNDEKNNYLFDPSALSKLKSSEFKFQYDKFEVTEDNLVDLGDGLVLRPLKRDDYERNYIGLMSLLTEVGNVTKQDFEKRFDQMKAAVDTYYICVVEDLNKNKVIASLTLVYEQKFIRQASSRGRFEDMVVDVDYRGKKLSKLLLDVCCQLSKNLGCYKISLECKDHLRKHYEQFEFALEAGQNYLCRRYI